MANIKDFSLEYFSLKGKVAMVTGANQGLGMAYALAFAKAGADLYIPHYTENITEVKELIEGESRRVEFLRGDLSDRGYIDEIVKDCLETYGKIDILVNNAGTNHFEDVMTFPDEQYTRVTDIQLNAVYYMTHEIGKVMASRGGGKIINIGSALSFTADNDCPAYVISKHAVLGITRYFASDFGKYNVQVNALCPGFFQSDIIAAISNQDFFDKITNRIPLGRWGETHDLMGAIVFLASHASDYMNGGYIVVDGGFATTI